MTKSLVQACPKSLLLDCVFLEDERWRIADFAVYYYRHNPTRHHCYWERQQNGYCFEMDGLCPEAEHSAGRARLCGIGAGETGVGESWIISGLAR